MAAGFGGAGAFDAVVSRFGFFVVGIRGRIRVKSKLLVFGFVFHHLADAGYFTEDSEHYIG